ncbi:MAG: B12-binding domain-containing radical SAM protein [Deltaproteobacteria bacterium]|nr:B12-binding domain-containing radical SAM protein [Deltaproteobacteria bacterium]
MKKIIFIEPNPPDLHVYSRMRLPRLGTVILGTILKQHGYNVKSYVEAIDKIDLKDVLTADAVGISTITSTARRSYEIARLVKKAGIPVFIGGPHVTYMPEEALPYCDFVIRGEFDDCILNFIKALESKKGLEDIPGLTYMKDGKMIKNKEAPFCKDLDKLPAPDFSIIKGLEKDSIRKFSITPVMTSRGCPFDCSFCSVTGMFGQKYRHRSTESVIGELRSHKENGSKWTFFYDDNFVANKKRTKELLKAMIENDLTPKWTAQVRVDVAKDPELLSLMKRSNCHTVYIGFESINPKTLELYNKKQSVEDIEDCIKKLHDSGIRIHGMFVFGSDQDTTQTMNLMSYYELQSETFRATKKFYSIGQIVKRAVKFDLFNVALKTYGRNITKTWLRKNQYFIDYTEALTKAGKNIELAAKKTAEDIKEQFRHIELPGAKIHPKTR